MWLGDTFEGFESELPPLPPNLFWGPNGEQGHYIAQAFVFQRPAAPDVAMAPDDKAKGKDTGKATGKATGQCQIQGHGKAQGKDTDAPSKGKKGSSKGKSSGQGQEGLQQGQEGLQQGQEGLQQGQEGIGPSVRPELPELRCVAWHPADIPTAHEMATLTWS